jgi:hypothetical protein
MSQLTATSYYIINIKRFFMKIIILVLFTAVTIYSQCSDAGVCSIGGESHAGMKKNSISLSYTFGKSDKTYDITYNSAALFAKSELIEGVSISASLPFNAQSGPAGSVSGIGDPIILIENIFIKENEFTLSAQAGVKLPLGDDNKEGLPQPYQSGLGATDFLAGISLMVNNFSFGAGYQKAGGRNNNILQLKRGDDLLLRAGYNYNFSPGYFGTLEILAIKRLQLSSITNFSGGYADVPGSDQFQVNLAATFIYSINEYMNLNLFGAVPLKKREVNPDGLTRAISLSAGVSYLF